MAEIALGHLTRSDRRAMRPEDLRRLCYAWTAAGLAVLAVLTASVPVDDGIAFPVPLPGIDPTVAGIAFWIVIATLATAMGFTEKSGARFVMAGGPLIATAFLGGPTAVAWVAALGTFELRELRGRVPWHRAFASHAHFTMAWAAGGCVLLAMGLTDEAEAGALTTLAAMLAAGLAANVIAVGFAMWAVSARTGRALRDLLPSPGRPLVLAIVADLSLGWLIAWAYLDLAWWSPLVLVLVDAVAIASLTSGRAAWDLRHDPLTSLPNSLALDERFARIERHGQCEGLVVFFIDLDGFKAVNDDHGHAAGDDVLKVVGGRLAAACRADDFVARLHGDEFVVVAGTIGSHESAQAFADRLQAAVEPAIERDGITLRVGATVGYALAAEGVALREALRLADHAMNRAKEAAVSVSGGSRSRR